MMPASTSPSATFWATPRTLVSLVATLDSAARAKSSEYSPPAASSARAFRAYAPAGASAAATAIRTPGRPRSASVRTASDPAGAATVSRLAAKYTGVLPASPAFFTAAICSQSAAANTSATAPCSSCVRRVWLPAKLNSTRTPG